MSKRLAALCIALALIAGVRAFATTYYVSPQGNDYFFGTSSNSPWASIARVNCADLRSGDQVLFLRGGTWRETLKPQASGLYFGAYGSGDRPVISGADLLGTSFWPFWFPAGSSVWSIPVDSAPTQMWFNGVVGTQVNSQDQVLAPQLWSYADGRVYVYSSNYPAFQFQSGGVEASQRSQALLLNNVTGVTVENIAFIDSGDVNACLCSGTKGTAVFNNDVFSGALNEGIRIVSGSAAINTSELINNGLALNEVGGQGFTMSGSALSGNHNQAILIAAATAGPSSINGSTISGNATTNPASEVITNYSSWPLTVSNSVLLPNPYQPKEFNFSGLSDHGNNVYESPLSATRAAPLIIVPFVDDYINLGVAQAVAKVASTYGCKLNYALNTKLVTPAAWSQIAAMQSAGVEVVAHTRSHSDLANNKVFSIQYTGAANTATMSINQTTGLLTTYLNGSNKPDLSISTSNTYNGIIDILGTIPAGSPYKVLIQPNQNFFTPVNLANVSAVNIKTAPYTAQAGPGYLTWEVEGAKADIAANFGGYQPKAFATPYTSSNQTVETHIQDAGFLSNRNGLLNADGSPDGNWVMATKLDVYNMGGEWLPFAYDTTKPASSMGALVEGLGASGSVMAIYSHGYNELTLQNWTDLFATLRQVGGTCMTMSQANAYIESHGQLIPMELGKTGFRSYRSCRTSASRRYRPRRVRAPSPPPTYADPKTRAHLLSAVGPTLGSAVT